MSMEQKWEKAVIIGGSMAGLMTARVLSDYYEEVVIVEKDDLPDQPEDRAGTPHAFHPHRFTLRGKTITDRLFPGFEDDLLALGAPSSQNKTVHNMNQYGSMVGPYPRKDVKFSRAALEWVIRERVKKIPGVRFITRHEVLRLITAPDQKAVIGVQMKEHGSHGQQQELAADLVVDTSGRGSKLAHWLEDMGLEVPAPDLLKADIGYATRRYKVPAHMTHIVQEWDVINITGQPANGAMGGVFSFIENEVAEVLLYRPGGHYPPTNAEAFERAVAGLPTSLIADIVRDLEPITAPKGFRVPELYRRHYERVTDWPSGLLVLGDACCIYDPIFGQGMTVAVSEAEILQSCLEEQRRNPRPHWERKVLRDMQNVMELAWWLNCANDLQWEGVEYAGSDELAGIRFAQRFLDVYLKQAMTEKDFKRFGLYWAVNTLSLSPREIMNPDMISSVLAQATEEEKQRLTELLEEGREELDAFLGRVDACFAQSSLA